VDLRGRHVISIADYGRDEILRILDTAAAMESGRHGEPLAGRLMATLFFEPSTRTRLSFEAAMLKLGGRVIGFSDPASSSAKKGETLADTIRMVERYADVIVMRHPRDGSARLAGEVSRVPVINGGDGSNQHPTQTFLDLYTISRLFPQMTAGSGSGGNGSNGSNGLTVAFAGDLRYGRTVHSLISALCHFGGRILTVAPRGLELPQQYVTEARHHGLEVEAVAGLPEAIAQCDVLYMTRLQEERFPDPLEFDHIKQTYRVTAPMLAAAKPGMRILHPLPRVNEIAPEVDATAHAHYFTQAANGIPVRQAILALVLGAVP
jgi:aspartate carbamoyltransferase catalytic subunit